MARDLQEHEEFLPCVRANQDFRLRTYYAKLRTDLEETQLAAVNCPAGHRWSWRRTR